VEPGRWRLIADLLEAASEGSSVGEALADVAAGMLGVDGVSLAFVVAGRPDSTVGSSPAAVELCEQQFALGEGPSVAALAADAPVLEDDLASADARARAPFLADAATRLGARAMFAFPLRVGGARVGVMTAHRTSQGSLSPTQFTDGLIVATLATIALLQTEAGASLGRIDVEAELSSGLHDTVQVAAGMVSEQLGVTIVEALVRMRARAFAEDVVIAELARRIVAGELRMER
jgi:GAF domain-containing protein